MKSKCLIILTIIISVLLISNVSAPISDENACVKEKRIENDSPIKTASATNNDSISMAESAARWLKDKWDDNKWNQTPDFYLGQAGVAGVGNFFIELYRETGNNTYRNWASSVGTWLINQHPVSYPAGKWPNIKGTSNIANYSGYLYGSAGIGSFFLNLHSINSTSAFLTQATNVQTYLQSIQKNSTSGLAWKEKDGVVLTGAKANPISRLNTTGWEVLGTQLSNLNSFTDGLYYEINSRNIGTEQTNVSYTFSLFDAGVPTEDLMDIQNYLTGFTVAISVKSSVTPTIGSSIQLFCYSNNSWVTIRTDGISTTENSYSKVININASQFTALNQIRVRVSSNSASGHRIQINVLNITVNYNNNYNSSSYATGSAGIGKFYLDLYARTSISTYLTRARAAGNFTIEKAITIGGNSSWSEKGKYYTGIDYGAAGIGNYLLELHQITGLSTYLTFTTNAAKWLIETGVKETISSLTTERWGEYNVSTNYFTGMDYCAGIGQFLLDLGKEIGGSNIYINNSAYAGNWLTSINYIVDREILYNLMYPIHKWKQERLGAIDYTYSKGGAGALEFLNNIFLETENTRFSEYTSRGLTWILRTINITNNYWAGDKSNMYISNGLAGIGLALLKLTLQRPSIVGYSLPNQLEYDAALKVTFEIKGFSSDISNAYISYDSGTSIWMTGYMTNESGDLYSYTFNSITYNTTIRYIIVVVDENNSLTLDDNKLNEYTLEVVDMVAPLTSLVPLYDEGLGASESGIIRIRVAQENIRGAAFTNVRVIIPEFDIDDFVYLSEFKLASSIYTFDFEIDTPADVNYGDEIAINVYTYDEANNVRLTTEILTIVDNFIPYCNIEEDFKIIGYTSWVPQMTEVKFEAKVTDVGSGLDDEEGVFVLYTTDNGAHWETAYLEKTSKDKYEGVIPAQLMLVRVYYVLGAEDRAGNYVVWDKYGTSYEDIDDIELEEMASYSVIVNLLMVAIIVGIIAMIAVVGYLLYSKRGGYLDKMRRKSKAVATGLVVKEKLTNMYYWMSEKINKLGEKLVKSRGGFSKAGWWLAEHFGERTEKAVKKVGRVLWAVPKGIGNSIKYFFVGVGRIITKSKAWQLFAVIILGGVFLISTLIQFIMEGGYPLRAIFFVNLGFLMMISGIVAFLLRFVYKLAYK